MKRTFWAMLFSAGTILSLVWLAFSASHSVAPTAHPAPANQSGGVSMLFASDPQFTWWRGGHDPDCKDDCVNDKGKETNNNLIAAMNNVMALGQWPSSNHLASGAGALLINPSGIIINGDLTSFWQRDEAHLFKDYYDDLQYTLYPGLGNHDYSNNLNDCTYLPLFHPDKNRCAKEAVWYMANTIQKLPNIVNKDLSGFVAIVNKGASVVRFKVEYDEDGEKKEKNSGSFPVLQTETLLIPKGSKSIKVTIENDTGNLTRGDIGWVKVDTYELSLDCRLLPNDRLGPGHQLRCDSLL
jgi:hypothetical protein